MRIVAVGFGNSVRGCFMVWLQVDGRTGYNANKPCQFDEHVRGRAVSEEKTYITV